MGHSTQAQRFAPSSRNCTSAETAIHAPGEPRGEDEQNAEDHGGPVLRGRSKEMGRPSSGADVRPQHLTPRVDQVHASTAELWLRTCGTQRRPPPCTRKCRRRSARRRRGQRNRRRRSPLREASLAEGHLRARPGELSTRFCETEQVLQPSSPGVALSPRRPRSQTGPPSVIRCQKVSRRN
jgi:hypothetical protein